MISAKSALRKRMRRARAGLLPDERRAAHAAMARHLAYLCDSLSPGGVVVLYAGHADEADPRALASLRSGTSIAWPRVVGHELELRLCEPGALTPGFMGIPEPPPESPLASLAQVRMLVVPGLAFDARGGRLGRGGGHYDRLLARVRAMSHPGLVVGLCYAAQVVSRVPAEPHDQRVDVVITERGLVPDEGIAGIGGA